MYCGPGVLPPVVAASNQYAEYHVTITRRRPLTVTPGADFLDSRLRIHHSINTISRCSFLVCPVSSHPTSKATRIGALPSEDDVPCLRVHIVSSRLMSDRHGWTMVVVSYLHKLVTHHNFGAVDLILLSLLSSVCLHVGVYELI